MKDTVMLTAAGASQTASYTILVDNHKRFSDDDTPRQCKLYTSGTLGGGTALFTVLMGGVVTTIASHTGDVAQYTEITLWEGAEVTANSGAGTTPAVTMGILHG